MAHGSYRPRWRETEKEQFHRYEVRELQKTMRLCSKCGQFNIFIFVKREVAYLHFACPVCGVVIQVTRLIIPKDDRKWE